MDIIKYYLCILYIFLLPMSLSGQEWDKQDSLRLRQMLESDQEIYINKQVLEQTEQRINYFKPFVDFDPTLPVLKSPLSFPKRHISTHNLFNNPTATFLPNYSRLKINDRIILQSKSNFTQGITHFHIRTEIQYKLSSKWALNMYGSQNLDTRRYRGLPSEIEPTTFGGNISYQINKNWKINTGLQFQHNAIRRRWEWVPQSSISYSW